MKKTDIFDNLFDCIAAFLVWLGPVVRIFIISAFGLFALYVLTLLSGCNQVREDSHYLEQKCFSDSSVKVCRVIFEIER